MKTPFVLVLSIYMISIYVYICICICARAQTICSYLCASVNNEEEEVTNAGDKERYFFCIRGKKYRNSIRPNRVTGSGFWKATGIDKPIYSVHEPRECIGLKKSLVYYRGSAGKGNKTDWMMHEFRLPPTGTKSGNLTNASNIAQEAVRLFSSIFSLIKYFP